MVSGLIQIYRLLLAQVPSSTHRTMPEILDALPREVVTTVLTIPDHMTNQSM